MNRYVYNLINFHLSPSIERRRRCDGLEDDGGGGCNSARNC